MALRVGGHADLIERAAQLVDRAEKRQSVVEVAVVLGVAADDEDAPEASLCQAWTSRTSRSSRRRAHRQTFKMSGLRAPWNEA